MQFFKNIAVCIVELRSTIRTWDLSLRGECTPCGSFLKYPSPYLRDFWKKKTRKTPNGSVDMQERGLNTAPPVNSFESRTVRLLVEQILQKNLPEFVPLVPKKCAQLKKVMKFD